VLRLRGLPRHLPQRAHLLGLLGFELAAARRDYSASGVFVFTRGPFLPVAHGPFLKALGILGIGLAAAGHAFDAPTSPRAPRQGATPRATRLGRHLA
jgi:hypothetical protein